MKPKDNEIYEINTTLIDIYCVLYLCMVIYIIRSEENISITRIFQYSKKFKGRHPLSI